jgi:Uma2 family endonuclease
MSSRSDGSTTAVASRPAVRLEDGVVIPADAGELSVFRRWAFSDAFPQTGRIDYLQGTIEVDTSPEELQTHGSLKGRLYAYIDRVVTDQNLGQVFVDRARLSCPGVGLSVEPDVMYVSLETLQSGRARYVARSTQLHRLTEVEGAVDLVVEVVSDSSLGKDRTRLPPLYAAAGVRELWIADGRGAEVTLQIFHLLGNEYRPASAEPDGFQTSRVLGRGIRLRREPWALPDTWRYLVDERQLTPTSAPA